VTRPRIAVVDDDPRLRQILQMFLTVQGYDVAIAEDGRRGLEMISNETPDLVILDVMMPGMDGIELCRRLRSIPETKAVPIVIYTALSDEDDVERARAAGANHMLTKPFNLEQFAGIIKALLAGEDPTPWTTAPGQ
jgi:DNA-binding response OmpR family regulator